MIEDSKANAIVNNYFFIQYEDLIKMKSPKEINNNYVIPFFALFQPIEQNYSTKTFLIKKRDGPENKIIIKEGVANNLNLGPNEHGECETIERSEMQTNIIIEIHKEGGEKINNKENTIFEVNKKGRKPISSVKASIHTKFSNDNILRKLKVKFLIKTLSYINRIIKLKYKDRVKILLPLKGEIAQNNNISFNKKLLSSKWKDIFSSYEISSKFTSFEKYYNRDVINSIYEQKINELIEILEMTFLELFNVFKDLNETEKLKGLEKLDVVVNEMRKKEKNEDYIAKFKNIAYEFEKHYINKMARKSD